MILTENSYFDRDLFLVTQNISFGADFGLGQCDDSGRPVRKLTRWMANEKCGLRELDRHCQGIVGWCRQGHGGIMHQPCYEAIASAAAEYRCEFCRDIFEECIGSIAEMLEHGR